VVLDFQKIYDRVCLKEIRLDKFLFSSFVRQAFYCNLPKKTPENFLPNKFLEFLSKAIVDNIVLKDRIDFKEEGIFLYSRDGILRRGAFALNVRAFVDVVGEVCTGYALRLEQSREKELFKDYEKVFLQTFLDESAMNTGSSNWKVTFVDNLSKILENTPRVYFET
jgi:hypothetical protein